MTPTLFAAATFACLAASPAALAAEPMKPAAPLAAHHDSARPLLIFTPRLNAPETIEQRERLEAARPGLDERDVAVYFIDENDGEPERFSGPETPPLSKADLRHHYDVDRGSFMVVLVGKDGGAKKRWITPVKPHQIFGQIDAMPMRASELR